jgi:hypothetical protein
MHTISKIIIWFLLVCSPFLGHGGNSRPLVIEAYPVFPEVIQLRKQLIKIAESQVGIRELTGNNDGPQVEQYLKSVGLGKGYPWCVAFVIWCHKQLNIQIPVTGWSPALFPRNVVYHRWHKRIREWNPRGGEVFGKYYNSKGRIAHAGIIREKFGKHFHTIEGNTSLIGAILEKMYLTQREKDEMDRNGIWVAHKIRKPEDIYIAADYVGDKEIQMALNNK